MHIANDEHDEDGFNGDKHNRFIYDEMIDMAMTMVMMMMMMVMMARMMMMATQVRNFVNSGRPCVQPSQ